MLLTCATTVPNEPEFSGSEESGASSSATALRTTYEVSTALVPTPGRAVDEHADVNELLSTAVDVVDLNELLSTVLLSTTGGCERIPMDLVSIPGPLLALSPWVISGLLEGWSTVPLAFLSALALLADFARK